jgi:hypothetical protein
MIEKLHRLTSTSLLCFHYISTFDECELVMKSKQLKKTSFIQIDAFFVCIIYDTVLVKRQDLQIRKYIHYYRH